MSKLVKAGATKSLILCHLRRALHKTRSLLSHLLKIKHYFGNDGNEDDKRLRSSSVYSSSRWRHYWSTSNHVRPLPEPLLFLQGSSRLTKYIEGEEADIVSCSTYNKPTVVLPDDQVPEVEKESYGGVGTPPWCSSQRYEGMGTDEINRLAEMFIANCREKFILEKEESYRVYQEMLARGV